MSSQLITLEQLKASRLTALKKMPPKFTEIFQTMDPAIASATEIELETLFKYTPRDFELRKKLWELVPIHEKIVVDSWVEGIVSDAYLYDKMVHNHPRIAWIFTPFTSNIDRYEELFYMFFAKMRKKIETMDINDDNFGAAIKLLDNISNRVMGAVPKNINLRAAHVHANAPGPKSASLQSPEELDKRIKELEAAKSINPNIIDVDPE